MKEENRWKNALIDALVVSGIYKQAHEDDPKQAINDLMAWEASLALDPCVSSEARDLQDYVTDDKISAICTAYEKGVEAGKSGDPNTGNEYQPGSPEDKAHAMGFNLGYEYRLSNGNDSQVPSPEQDGN